MSDRNGRNRRDRGWWVAAGLLLLLASFVAAAAVRLCGW